MDNYHRFACEMADDEKETRRGIWHLEKEDLVCIYDTMPYQDDPDARPRQELRIVRELKKHGIKTLAHGHSVDHECTTILLDCSWDRLPLIQQTVIESIQKTMSQLYGD